MAQRERDGVRGFDREVSRFRCHIRTAPFAAKDVEDVTSRDIREWLREMALKKSALPGATTTLTRQTVKRSASLVSAIFFEAVERDIIDGNPCAGVKIRKRVDESDTREKWAYLTPDEQRAIRLCREIPIEDRLMIAFSHDPALAAARAWLDILDRYAPSNPENLVFPTPGGRLRQQGKPLLRGGLVRAHYAAAGVTLRPHLHWHALRHTFASNLIAGVYGRPWRLEEVQIVMGHSSYVVTQRYAHLGEDAITKAARETAAAYGRAA